MSDETEPRISELGHVRHGYERRSRRFRNVRAKTVSIKRLTKKELEMGRRLAPNVPGIAPPATRLECTQCAQCQEWRKDLVLEDGDEGQLLDLSEILLCGHSVAEAIARSRPCLFVSCKMNLFLDVDGRTGAIKLNFPDLEPGDMKHSCTLDIAALGGVTLEDCGEVMNVTRERTRQLECNGLARMKVNREFRSGVDAAELEAEAGRSGKRRLPVLDSSFEDGEE